MQNVCRACRSICAWAEWEWRREGGLLSGWKKVGLGYIRTILLKRLKQLKAGILHIHSAGKLIKSQRDRRLRTLRSTPFVRDSLFIKLSFFSRSPPSELSSRGSMQRKTWQPTAAPAHRYWYCNREGTTGWRGSMPPRVPPPLLHPGEHQVCGRLSQRQIYLLSDNNVLYAL